MKIKSKKEQNQSINQSVELKNLRASDMISQVIQNPRTNSMDIQICGKHTLPSKNILTGSPTGDQDCNHDRQSRSHSQIELILPGFSSASRHHLVERRISHHGIDHQLLKRKLHRD
jgi:hypothetical protein